MFGAISEWCVILDYDSQQPNQSKLSISSHAPGNYMYIHTILHSRTTSNKLYFRCLKSQRGRPKKGDIRNRKENSKKSKKVEKNEEKIEIKVLLESDIFKNHQV